LAPAPDILISGDGRLLAVRSAEGKLLLSSGRAGRFSAAAWLRRAGQADKILWPRQGASADGKITCDGLGCVYKAGLEVVALARDPRALAEDCRLATIVVSSEPVRVACAGAKVVIDRFDIWKKGSHALWLSGDGVIIRNARDMRGDRPWVLKPEQTARRQR
jgi:competence protein ComEC